MGWLILLAVVAVIIGGGLHFCAALLPEDLKLEDRRKYKYTAKKYFMTRAEHEFYDILGQAVGQDFRIFAQVHLASFLDERTKGQNWKAARARINRKSVDFLLCDKEKISPKLAIEIDDKTHERPDRMERDAEVERILREVGIPLLRLPKDGGFAPADVAQKNREAMSPTSH